MAEYLGTNKKTVELQVNELNRLIEGKSVNFAKDGNVYKTSPVESIFYIRVFPDGKGTTLFETKNTRYSMNFNHYTNF